uniref:UBC core domain-containing protein n=1 Tax=Timema douglasi TaxID=61478 RepID=A0A7R8VDM1_TIMDO|nr:unnamed protein product [Timema douglasi]
MNPESKNDTNKQLETNISKDILIKELVDWCKNNNRITFVTDQICEDGRICLNLTIGKGQEFLIICPLNYPNYDDNFFVEAVPKLQLWCNELNEFILDSDEVLSLTHVLNKADSSYYHKSSSLLDSLSSDSDQDYEEEDMDSDIDYFEIDVCQMKRKWQKKEIELRSQNGQTTSSDMCIGVLKNNSVQVFSNSAASGILMNELIAILKEKDNTGVTVHPINDNIYQWSVKFSKFDPESALHRDLQELKKKHGYDYIELQLEFTMDLYPFYPPVAKVVRPRLDGDMMLQVANMEVLKLSHWNPARSMQSILHEIKEYVNTWERVDTHSPKSCPLQYPQGAYSNIENHLLWLGCVSEMPSRARAVSSPQRSKADSSDVNNAKQSDSKISPFVNTSGLQDNNYLTGWLNSPEKPFPNDVSSDKLSCGVTYDHEQSSNSSWNIHKYLAAQREKDKQVVTVLQKILEELQTERHSSSHDASDKKASIILSSNNSTQQVIGNKADSVGLDSAHSSASNGHAEHNCLVGNLPDGVFEILKASSLVPFLESKLHADSFLEITQHAQLYKCVINLINEISCWPQLVPLLWTLPNQVQSLYTLSCRLCSLAQDILNKVGKTVANGNVSKIDNTLNAAAGENSTEKLAQSLCDMSERVRMCLVQYRTPSLSELEGLEPVASTQQGHSQACFQKYTAALKDMQSLMCDVNGEYTSAVIL